MYVSMFLLSDIFGMIIIQYENLGALPRVLCWAYGSRHDEPMRRGAETTCVEVGALQVLPTSLLSKTSARDDFGLRTLGNLHDPYIDGS